MKAYSYHPITNEYIGEVNCQPNPVDGGFLLPGHATYGKPPLVEMKQAAVWTGKWEIKADHRGEVYWDKDTQEEQKIAEIGQVKDENWTKLQPISERAVWETDKWIEPPLTFEELQEKEDAEYRDIMPDIVKTLEERIAALEKTGKEMAK